MIALAPSFSTVYNLLLCLHIFSVHIIHQSKKRNYENLDQLSYDNKRGPKVYMHGRARHPPTREPWPRRLGHEGRCPAQRAAPPACAERRGAREAGSRRQERTGAGCGGACGPPPVASACAREAGPAAEELLSGKCMRISGTPRVSSWSPGGSPRPSRPPACGPGRSGRACGPGPRGTPVVLKKSAPSLLPIAFQNCFLFPVRCTPLSESRSTSACMLGAKVRPGVRGGERHAEQRVSPGERAG